MAGRKTNGKGARTQSNVCDKLEFARPLTRTHAHTLRDQVLWPQPMRMDDEWHQWEGSNG